MTLVWAHRGASGYAPENTLESFKLAAEMKADGVELDVQLTKDGKMVVCHDESIDRTSNGKGFIKDWNFEQLRTLNFNNHNEKYPYCQIPTLKEVLELLKPTGLTINIELKTSVFLYEGIEKMVVDLVKELDMKDKIIYSSFNHNSIKTILELDPQAYCGFLHCDKVIDMASYAKKYCVKALHPAYYYCGQKDYIADCFKNGILINAWTVNDPQYMMLAYQIGINALITNYPDVALRLRDNLK